MAGNGRPQKYHDCVEPYLAEIKKMALTMTEEQIAKTLGVSYSSFRKYKGQHEELQEALKKGENRLLFRMTKVNEDAKYNITFSKGITMTENIVDLASKNPYQF